MGGHIELVDIVTRSLRQMGSYGTRPRVWPGLANIVCYALRNAQEFKDIFKNKFNFVEGDFFILILLWPSHLIYIISLVHTRPRGSRSRCRYSRGVTL